MIERQTTIELIQQITGLLEKEKEENLSIYFR